MMQTAGFTIKGAGKALAGEKLLDINHRQFGYTCCQGHALKENAMHNPIAGFEWKPLNRFSMTAKVTQADVYAYIAKAKQLMKQKAASAKYGISILATKQGNNIYPLPKPEHVFTDSESLKMCIRDRLSSVYAEKSKALPHT